MRHRTHSVRTYVDRLEARDVPAANLTVTFSPVTHTLTVVGDANDNDVTVAGDFLDPTHFVLNSSNSTINGEPPPYSTPSGVRSLVFKMLDGNDSVTFDPTVPIFVRGSVSIDGGAGVNSVAATHLTVGKNLSVTNAAQTTGLDSVVLIDFSAGGSVQVKNAGGDSYTAINRDGAGVSTIKGSLTVTNGTGEDSFNLNDTNVEGNITINDGHGNAAGVAGFVNIYNLDNTALRSIIGGNLTVTYLDGNANTFDGLWDTEVLGNVTLNHGLGVFTTYMDGYATHLPVLIHGNLTITGAGANSLGFGTDNGSGNGSGLIVGKKFTLTSGSGTAETLAFKNVQVGGDTALTLGNGGNTITIDDSIFGGRFALVSGVGNDTFNLEATTGTTSATEFKKAALIDLGSGNDLANLAYNSTPDAGEAVICLATFETKTSSAAINYSYFYFPNGGAPSVL
jgi:hypothetical protein